MNSLKGMGWWAYKIPDFPVGGGTIGFRFNPEKPFDIACFSDSGGIAVEGKQFKKYKAFGARHMRPSQIQAFDEIVGLGVGRAFVFLNIRASKPRMNRLITFDWAFWGKRIKSETIKAKELRDFWYVEGKRGLFDLSFLR